MQIKLQIQSQTIKYTTNVFYLRQTSFFFFILYLYRALLVTRNRLETITSGTDSPDLTFSNELPDVLLDLTKYQHDSILQRSLLLLNRHYSTDTEIFNTAAHIHLLLTEESVAVYEAVDIVQSQLRDYLHGYGEDTTVVQTLIDLCYLKNDVREPHEINQTIILTFGKQDEFL